MKNDKPRLQEEPAGIEGLEKFLEVRIREADRGEISDRSHDEIFDAEIERYRRRKNLKT